MINHLPFAVCHLNFELLFRPGVSGHLLGEAGELRDSVRRQAVRNSQPPKS
jgi:hypothetical protein